MKTLAIILVFAGLTGLAFGYWRLNTPAGRTRFDEMVGLYPHFGGVAGGIPVLVAFVLAFFSISDINARLVTRTSPAGPARCPSFLPQCNTNNLSETQSRKFVAVLLYFAISIRRL